MNYTLLAVVVLLFVLFSDKIKSLGINITNEIDPPDVITGGLSSDEVVMCKTVYNKIKNFPEVSIGSVSLAQKLAMICMESGHLIVNGKNNNEIIGDNGHAVGFCQVSLSAIADVNNKLGTNYTKNDCLINTKINLTVGFTYLDMCFKSALNQSSKNPVKTTFKKYNGGIDETDISVNLMASKYSSKAEKYYNYYKEFLV